MSSADSSDSRSPGGGDARAGADASDLATRRRRNRLILLALLVVCAAPVIASYLMFYVFPPDGRVNYGELVQPQRDLNRLAVIAQQIAEPAPEQQAIPVAAGERADFAAFNGRWLMVVPSDACDDDCRERLIAVRQVRLTTGRERSRVERVWLRTLQAPAPDELLAQHPGLHVLQIDPERLAEHFPAAAGQRAQAHIYMVDPLGHLMMRWPVRADPNRMKKDLMRLLKASRIG
ncbi:MAG: cytochrome C oxidase subunit I [Burkholderiaceae bacterium]